MAAYTIALDAMGGDHGLEVVVPAALMALKNHSDLDLILVGDEAQILECLKRNGQRDHPQLHIQHAPETVTMDESPSHALRNKKKSSMRIALNLVKDELAQACVSAGNTGALMATARFVLKTLPGIDRPAIIAELPTQQGKIRMLDLGANVDSCAEHLFQFAVMGAVLVSAVDKIASPKIGLLNIGVEEIKGNDQVKRTAQLLSDNKAMNYIGYVEADSIYKGVADLIVCDGFVGNVALKASEGLAKLMGHFIRQAFERNILTKAIGLLTLPVMKSLKKQMDPSRYNGASLVGLNGIVVKSHGGANVLAYRYAIEEAIAEVQNNVPLLIREQVADLLNEGILA